MFVYVASSWRNDIQQRVVRDLRSVGYQVYDFRNPGPGDNGFAWSQIEKEWQNWSPAKFRESLEHPSAIEGFSKDMSALQVSDACVLIQPCGISSHLELGYAVGSGIPTAVLLSDGEPELMYKMVDALCVTYREVLEFLKEVDNPVAT